MADKYPQVSRELVEYMERSFPDRCPDPAITDREVWIAVGAAKAVKALRNLYTRQSETVVGSS